MRLYEDALTDAQRDAAARAAPVVTEESFYLAGGTALALQLGHRRSVDLDWFRRQPMGDPLRVARALGRSGLSTKVTTSTAGTLYAVADGVKMSFLEYPYKLVSRSVPWTGAGVRLASLMDIACMKLSAIADRGAKKDFIDLYFLGQKITLEQMLTSYQRKYGVTDIAHLVVALAYFDDAERQRMPSMIDKTSWKTMKRAVQAWVRALR